MGALLSFRCLTQLYLCFFPQKTPEFVPDAVGFPAVGGEGTQAVAAVVGPMGLDRVREWSNRSN